MKHRFKIILLGIILLVLLILSYKKPKAVTDCISVKEDDQIIQSRGIDTKIQKLYLNKKDDPEFFVKIVSELRNCNSIKNLKCQEIHKRVTNGDFSKYPKLSSDMIVDSFKFISSNHNFTVIVSNGQSFTIVIYFL